MSLSAPTHSSPCRHARGRTADRRRSGFGLLELLTVLAFLTIVLGLMVSLARYVRAGASEQLTRTALRRLDAALAAHMYSAPDAGPDAPADPDADLDPPAAAAGEAAWAAYAAASNAAVARLLAEAAPVHDAWGLPIGYLAGADPRIGMAPHDRPFCFSAGPDGQYLTQADNLYSYEQISATPATRPAAGGGHGE